MVADSIVIIDGHTYQKGDTLPDLGSLRCVKANGNIRFYVGLAADVSKLPKYDDLASGSRFKAVDDSSSSYIYEATTKKWYKQKNEDSDEKEFKELWSEDLTEQVDPNYLLNFNEGGDWTK